MHKKIYDLKGKRIFVAGHRGMVGQALMRRLANEDCQILTISRKQLDLLRQSDVEDWMEENRPDSVIIAAAKVGGIYANDSYPADFLYENLMIECNLIKAAAHSKVEKLLFLGSSCIYPKMAPQPIGETALLSGPLEPTNEAYAIAKIAGIKLCEAMRKQYGADFISAMPTNLYGPSDNYDILSSHVMPAMIRKVHEAKTLNAKNIVLWGSGQPLREFMHVDDCADACIFLLEHYSQSLHVNVGSGQEISIKGLAQLVCSLLDYHGEIVLDPSKPDGTPRKLLDSTRLNQLGWRPAISLEQGIKTTYEAFLTQMAGE